RALPGVQGVRLDGTDGARHRRRAERRNQRAEPGRGAAVWAQPDAPPSHQTEERRSHLMDHKSLSVLILGGAALLAALMAPGQDGRQEWRMSPAGRGDRVHFTIEHWKGGSHSSTSTDVQLDRFRGFNPSLFDHAGDAQFEYVHDAGRLVCKGHFSFGRGAGNFTFTPDPSFVAALQKLGYDAPREEQLFTM